MSREDNKKFFEDLLEFRVIYEELAAYAKQHKCVVRLDEPYSIERIRKAVVLYSNDTITKEYFFLWCKLCAREIKQYCTEYSHQALAKQEVAKCLMDIANGGNVADKLQEIEDVHRIVTGERKSSFLLAEDLEAFYCCQGGMYEDDEDESVVDILFINHYQKTFSLLKDYVIHYDEDYCDGLGGCMIPQSISKTIFDLLVNNIHTLGYKEKDEV